MTTTAKFENAPDLLRNGATGPAGRSRGLLVPTACAVAGALLGGALVWAVPNGGDRAQRRAPVSMSGTMIMGDFASRPVDVGSGQDEDRDARGRGSIELHLPDRDLVGRASLAFSASSMEDAPGGSTTVVHSWGTVTATFGETVCRGSFGFSYFSEPTEAGGSLQLRCDDESAAAAVMAVTQAEDVFVFDLRNGWYVPPEVPSDGAD